MKNVAAAGRTSYFAMKVTKFNLSNQIERVVGKDRFQFPLTMLYFSILHEINVPVLGPNFTLNINAGEILVFVGGSGSGTCVACEFMNSTTKG